MTHRILLAALVLALTPLIGVGRLPVVAVIVLIACGTERLTMSRQIAELRNALGAAERGAQMQERFGALTSADLRSRAELPAPPKLRPNEHWEAQDTGSTRRWVIVTDKPTLRARLAAWYTTTAPRYQAQRGLVAGPVRRLTEEPVGRHRTPVVVEEPAAPTPAAIEPAWTMPSGEFAAGVTGILEASILAGVARGAR